MEKKSNLFGMSGDAAMLFAKAALGKWRFQTSRGELAAEALFDLPLKEPKMRAGETEGIRSLQTLEVSLTTVVETAAPVSYVDQKLKATTVATAKEELQKGKLELVRAVIDYAVAKEQEQARKEQRRQERAKVLELIDRQREQALGSLTLEELEARLAALPALDS